MEKIDPSELDIRRYIKFVPPQPKIEEVEKMEEVKERKPLPKFSCKVSKGQFNSIEVKVYIPTNYLKKVMGD